jgi:hypothetical protein
MAEVKAKNPGESEFHQAVQEVVESLTLVMDRKGNVGSYLNIQHLQK